MKFSHLCKHLCFSRFEKRRKRDFELFPMIPVITINVNG